MSRRAVPAGLVVAAAFADASGAPLVAFYALLALVPVAVLRALQAYGDVLEQPRHSEEETQRRFQTLLWACLLVLAVVGAAARAPAIGEGTAPRLAGTALIACLVILCVEGTVELVAHVRRPASRRPAEPLAGRRVEVVWENPESPLAAPPVAELRRASEG